MRPLFRNLIAVSLGLTLGWLVSRSFAPNQTPPTHAKVLANSSSGTVVMLGRKSTERGEATANEKREWETYLAQTLPPDSPFNVSQAQARLAELAGQAARGSPVRAEVE